LFEALDAILFEALDASLFEALDARLFDALDASLFEALDARLFEALDARLFELGRVGGSKVGGSKGFNSSLFSEFSVFFLENKPDNENAPPFLISFFFLDWDAVFFLFLGCFFFCFCFRSCFLSDLLFILYYNI
jgi:hypothetical protein